MAATPKEFKTDNPRASRRSLTHISMHSETARMGAAFERHIGIDYSGAKTRESGLKGLRVYIGDRATEPREAPPPTNPRWYWTRKAIAQWHVGGQLGTVLQSQPHRP